MNNAELIKALRWCGSDDERHEMCVDESYSCPLWNEDRMTDYCKADLMFAVADALEAAEKRIAELEAQLPKEGEWIEDDMTYCGADRANYKCSLCGKIGYTWKRGLTQDELPNYCPNCGSRMAKGEQE